MQLYTYDKVIVKDGVCDEEALDTNENPVDLSGLTGHISNIGYRDDLHPITVEIYNEDTGFFTEIKFKPEELEVVL